MLREVSHGVSTSFGFVCIIGVFVKVFIHKLSHSHQLLRPFVIHVRTAELDRNRPIAESFAQVLFAVPLTQSFPMTHGSFQHHRRSLIGDRSFTILLGKFRHVIAVKCLHRHVGLTFNCIVRRRRKLVVSNSKFTLFTLRAFTRRIPQSNILYRFAYLGQKRRPTEHRRQVQLAQQLFPRRRARVLFLALLLSLPQPNQRGDAVRIPPLPLHILPIPNVQRFVRQRARRFDLSQRRRG